MKKSSIIICVISFFLLSLAIALLFIIPEHYLSILIFTFITFIIIYTIFGLHKICPNCWKMSKYVFKRHNPYYFE